MRKHRNPLTKAAYTERVKALLRSPEAQAVARRVEMAVGVSHLEGKMQETNQRVAQLKAEVSVIEVKVQPQLGLRSSHCHCC